MKKAISLLLAVSLFFVLSLNANAKEIVQLTSSEWPPFHSEKLKSDGFLSKIVVDAFALEGIKIEIEFLPAKRAYQYAINNPEWMGSYVWGKNASLDVGYALLNENFTPEERKLITYHPKPHYSATVHVIFHETRKGSPRLIKILNRGLKKLKESGQFEQIVQAQHRGEFVKK